MNMDSKDKQIEKNKTMKQSMKYALIGIKTAFEDERNMKYHVFMTILVILAGLFFKIGPFEWLWLALAITLVLILEVTNTAFENLVDLVTGKTYHILAKKVKDMTAGSVLISVIFAVFTGIIIFVPKIISFIFN